MSGIYDGGGGVISKEKNLHIPLSRESRHGPVVPGTMNRGSCLGQLMPVGRSHEQYFMTEIKEKQHRASNGCYWHGVESNILRSRLHLPLRSYRHIQQQQTARSQVPTQ